MGVFHLQQAHVTTRDDIRHLVSRLFHTKNKNEAFMQQHEQTVGLLEAIFGGSNASMSENSEQEQPQRYSKTIPRIEMILSVMYGGDKRALDCTPLDML